MEAAPAEADSRATANRSSATEDHWSIVLKKLAPAGYHKAPQWQQELISKVVKQMNRRQKGGLQPDAGVSKEQLQRTIDLSALGVSPEVAETFRLEEQRVSKAMRELPGPGSGVGAGGKDGAATAIADALTAVEKQLADRSNQVHYYIRAIQMEQLLEQDLEADLKAMRDEVGAAVKDEQFGQSKAASVRLRLERQLGIVKKRCDALTVKASEIGSDNSNVRLNIDDLRKEKMSHREQLTRMKAKAEKMDADIAFLTHQSHAALDQREKVRGKFLMAQRDMMQEREQKLAVIAELVTRANALDDDWSERQAQIADAEEQRRRQAYGSGRKRRETYESAEVRFGFLTAQSRGWESEFERLQSFTGMETKFDPREKEGKQVVEEITSRYAEKERANTSLLRYLNEQQAEIGSLTEQHKEMQSRREELQALLGLVPSGYGGGATPESLLAAATAEDNRSDSVEGLLDGCCGHVHVASKALFREGRHPAASGLGGSADTKCTIKTLERWLAALEKRLLDVYSACQALCAPDEDGRVAVERPPLVLSDWCQRDKVHKVPKVTVPEIHDALCLQAAQQRRGGELEDDEEEIGEEAKKDHSPFQRAKVNKAQERQRIIEWARKRQPGQQQVKQAVESATSGGTAPPVRTSASAPSLRRGPPAAPGAAANGAPATGAGMGGMAATCGTLPAIGEGSSSGRRGDAKAERAAAYTAQHGAVPPPPPPPPAAGSASGGSAAALPGKGKNGGGGAAGRLRAAASASMPGLSTPTSSVPKDLGTVIYLLGTQSNSMNARRFLDGRQS